MLDGFLDLHRFDHVQKNLEIKEIFEPIRNRINNFESDDPTVSINKISVL